MILENAQNSPNEWIRLYLPDIALIIMGQSPSSSDINEIGEGLVFFQGKAEFGKLHPIPKKYCTNPKKIAEGGDILLSVRAPVGPTNVADRTTVIGRGLVSIRAFPGVNQQYLLYFFRAIEPWMSKQGTGTTFRAISSQFLQELPFLLPPLAEQQQIAAKLDELLAQVDTLKTRLDAIPKILKRFRQSVLAAAVSGKLTEDFRKNNGISDWKTIELSQLEIEVQIGPFGSLLHKSDYIEGGVPLVNPMHIADGKITPSDSMTVSQEKAFELQRYKLKFGDIILGRRGEMGRAAVIKNDGLLCGTGSLFLRPNLKYFSSEFVCFVLSASETIKYLTESSVGTTMVNLNQGILRSLPFPQVGFEEQSEIVNRVEQFFIYADQIEQRVQDAQSRVNHLTQSILTKAFRGELTAEWRAQNLDLIRGENSAEALLAKIKAEQTKPATSKRPKL